MTAHTSSDYRGPRVVDARSSLPNRQATHWLIVMVQSLAACLLMIEVAVLFIGVTARYAFGRPLLWTDEVASILFLWLAMLGTVAAYGRGEHMRMTALVDLGGPRTRLAAEALARMVGLVFLGGVLVPALSYTWQEALVATPVLGISNAWRVAALPAGIALMLAIGALSLICVDDWRRILMAAVTVLALGAALTLMRSQIVSLGRYDLLVFFVLLLGSAVLVGIPIAFAFGLATLAYLALASRVPLTVLVGRIDEGMSNIVLLAVPLFVLLGLLFELTGMAKSLVAFLVSLIGHTRAGLHYVLIGAIYVVSGISGSKTADMAAVAPALFPEMRQRGARPGDLVALLAATGAQTETIAPSLVLITIGTVTDISIADLFKAGFLPALVLAIVLIVMVAARHRRSAPAGVPRATRKLVLRSGLMAAPALFLPLLIRAVVVEGVATATEVSTIGIVYALIFGMVNAWLTHQQLSIRRLWTALTDTSSLSGAILFIIGCATATAWALTQSGFSSDLAAFMSTLPGGYWVFMVASVALFAVLGSILEGIPAMVLFAPLLFPIAGAVGIDKVHYAIVTVLSMGLGLFSPPFGVGYYTACAIGRVEPGEGMRPIVPYMLALLAGIALIAAVPWITVGPI